MLVIGKSPDWAPGKVRRIQDDIRLLISRTLSFDSTFLWLCEILLFCTKASDVAVAQKRFRGLLKPAKETASQIESLAQICLGDSESFDNVKGYTAEELAYQIMAKLLPGWTSVRNARFENQEGPVCGASNLDVFFGRGEYNRHQVQLMIDGDQESNGFEIKCSLRSWLTCDGHMRSESRKKLAFMKCLKAICPSMNVCLVTLETGEDVKASEKTITEHGYGCIGVVSVRDLHNRLKKTVGRSGISFPPL